MMYTTPPHRESTDKLDEVHPGEPAGSIRGQMIGLLSAIQYLKCAFFVFVGMSIYL